MLGVLLPVAKGFPERDEPQLAIKKGPRKGQDLALVAGSTPEIIGRNACKIL